MKLTAREQAASAASAATIKRLCRSIASLLLRDQKSMHKTPPMAAVEGFYRSRPCPSSAVRCGTDRPPLLRRQVMRCSDGHFPGLERTNAFSYQIQSYLLHMQCQSRPEHTVSQHRGALPRTCTRLVVGPLAACGVRRLSGEGQVMRAIHMKDKGYNSSQVLRMST